jgi:hypothetical protein
MMDEDDGGPNGFRRGLWKARGAHTSQSIEARTHCIWFEPAGRDDVCAQIRPAEVRLSQPELVTPGVQSVHSLVEQCDVLVVSHFDAP